MARDPIPSAPDGRCPICDAGDAYIGVRIDRDYFVECLNCGVYRASRKAFRHFEYLRERGEPVGLHKLQRLATWLKARQTGANTHLDYDTWQELIGIERENDSPVA